MIALAGVVFALQTFAHMPLDRAETLALGQSPDVIAASEKVNEQEALFRAARASYGPALLTSYALAPQGGPDNTTVAQRLTTFGGQVTLGDVIAYSPAVAQANANLDAARFDLANARRSERINVITLYFTALSNGATLAARREALTGARAELRAAQLRYRGGDAPRLDVVRAQVAVSQAQADVARAQADSDNAGAALALELGVSTKDLTAADEPSAPIAPWEASAEAAVSEALAHRPEVASAQANVAAEEHAVAVAQRGAFPAVNISGGYTTGVDSDVKVSGPSLTVNATLPVGSAAHDRADAERARLAQAKSQLSKVERQITNDVGAAVRTYQAQSAALASATRALADARAEYAATQIGYKNGASSSLDVESARATYVQASLAQISALYAQAQARATLDLLVGSEHA